LWTCCSQLDGAARVRLLLLVQDMAVAPETEEADA